MAARQLRIEVIVNVLTYIVGLIGFLSVCREVRMTYFVVFIALLALSAFLTYLGRLIANRWILNTLAVAVIASCLFGLDARDFITQMLETLLFLMCIKLLEQKKVRDHMQIYVISLLLVAGSGLLSLSIVFVVLFFALFLVLTSAAILLSYYSQDSNMMVTMEIAKKIVRNSLLIPSVAIPMTAAVFIILPRTSYPLFNVLSRQEKAHSGFSDEVTLGTVSSIQEDSSVVMRVNMDRIEDNNLYWRGVVLDHFDGVSWRGLGKRIAVPSRLVPAAGKLVAQTIYLEPYENRRLFALDKPIFISLRSARHLDDSTFISSTYLARRIKYQAESALSDIIAERHIDYQRYLQLPANISARTASLVRELGRGKTEDERLASFQQYLAGGAFKYSLNNLPLTKNPVDTFLFQSRYGNCEYFASAYVVMLRISGIPARIVGGYRGGYYNGVGNYYLVAERDAHVWAEAYVKGKGWLRVDPTPTSPGRFGSAQQGLFLRMNLLLDTMNYYWYAFVVNYNFEKQAFFIHSLGSAIRKPQLNPAFHRNRYKSAEWFGIFVVIGGLCFLLRDVRIKRKPPAEKLLNAFRRRMEKRGYRKTASQGLEEFVSSVTDEKSRLLASRFVNEFEELYYKDKKPGKEQIKHLTEIIKSI